MVEPVPADADDACRFGLSLCLLELGGAACGFGDALLSTENRDLVVCAFGGGWMLDVSSMILKSTASVLLEFFNSSRGIGLGSCLSAACFSFAFRNGFVVVLISGEGGGKS